MGAAEPHTLDSPRSRAHPRIARDLLPTMVRRRGRRSRAPPALPRAAGTHVRRAMAHTTTPPRAPCAHRPRPHRDIPRRRRPRSCSPALVAASRCVRGRARCARGGRLARLRGAGEGERGAAGWRGSKCGRCGRKGRVARRCTVRLEGVARGGRV